MTLNLRPIFLHHKMGFNILARKSILHILQKRSSQNTSGKKKMNYDVCIVGAGMFGSAAARHASAKAGVKVCLIGPNEPSQTEWKKKEIYSSYYDEGRITRVADRDFSFQYLSRRSMQRFEDLESLSGSEFYKQVGCLFKLTRSSKYYKALLEANRENNLLLNLSDKELHIRYPFFKFHENDVLLLEMSSAGYINPRRMVAAQKKVAEMQGCHMYEDVVTKISQTENMKYQVSLENSETEITCQNLLITTGSFINTKIAGNVLPILKVKKYKRTVTLFEISPREAERLRMMPCVIYQILPEDEVDDSTMRTYAYILPAIKYPDDKIYLKIGIYGTHLEAHSLKEIRDWFNCPGHKKTFENGAEIMLDLLPGLKYESITSSTCVNCYTETGLPYIDRLTPTLTVAVAGNGKGATFSDEVGRLAALLTVNGVWDSKINNSLFKAVLKE